MKKILTVAGSDSSGGAGIQADLKAIALLGEYGLSVITALTAQNTQGVQAVQPVSSDFIAAQWDAVVSDIPVDAVKTGMLVDEQIIRLVAQKLRTSKIPIRVLDPVMVSKNGKPLLSRKGRSAFISELLPLATMVTPNLPEAAVLSGHPVRSIPDMERAARRIQRLGAQWVLVKGGHRKGQAEDVLWDGKSFFHFTASRIQTSHTHGTGCTLASAIAVEMTRSHSVPEAVEKAKKFITDAIAYAEPLGKGQGPTNPYGAIGRELELGRARQALKEAFEWLQGHRAGTLIPEVRSNLGYAIPEARSVADVVAFPGRIGRRGEEIFAVASPEPGASLHVAGLILAVMAFQPEYRSALNIRFSPDILCQCRKQNWVIRKWDRSQEQKSIKNQEGASLMWGIESVLTKSPRIPDVIYDLGDLGKEPIIRILGKTPKEVVNKALCLI